MTATLPRHVFDGLVTTVDKRLPTMEADEDLSIQQHNRENPRSRDAIVHKSVDSSFPMVRQLAAMSSALFLRDPRVWR